MIGLIVALIPVAVLAAIAWPRRSRDERPTNSEYEQ